MATLRDIKRRITSVANTAKITSAMKMVSAAKLKRSQRLLNEASPYHDKIKEMLSNILPSVEGYSNILIEPREEIKTVAFIIIADDKGLCGSFNSNTFKEVALYLKGFDEKYPNANFRIIPLGNKSVDFYKKSMPDKIDFSFNSLYSSFDHSAIKPIIDFALENYANGKYDEVIIFYNGFVNIVKQAFTVVRLLPLDVKIEDKVDVISNYIYEPTKEKILDTLIPLYINAIFRKVFLSSNTAAHAARMLAMDNATNNARELIKFLNLQYNKARQASITTEMLEIVSGANALKG